jgi:hypothetical protein
MYTDLLDDIHVNAALHLAELTELFGCDDTDVGFPVIVIADVEGFDNELLTGSDDHTDNRATHINGESVFNQDGLSYNLTNLTEHEEHLTGLEQLIVILRERAFDIITDGDSPSGIRQAAYDYLKANPLMFGESVSWARLEALAMMLNLDLVTHGNGTLEEEVVQLLDQNNDRVFTLIATAYSPSEGTQYCTRYVPN